MSLPQILKKLLKFSNVGKKSFETDFSSSEYAAKELYIVTICLQSSSQGLYHSCEQQYIGMKLYDTFKCICNKIFGNYLLSRLKKR